MWCLFNIVLFVLVIQSVTSNPSEILTDDSSNPGPLWRYEYEYSIKNPYVLSANSKVPIFYDLYQDAQIGKKSIILTQGSPYSKGAIWSKKKNELDEWMVVLTLKILKNNISETGSDGFAFWYTADKGKNGPVFGSAESWLGMGIILDSYDNDGMNDNPMIQAVYNSGSYSYKPETDGKDQYFAHGFFDFRNSNQGSIGKVQTIVMKVIYYNRTLEVFIDKDSSGFNFEKVITYSPIYLTKGYYFGLSASAGDLFPDSHHLVAMEVYSIRPPLIEDSSSALFSKSEKEKIHIHDQFKADIMQKVSQKHLQNVSDLAFKTDVYTYLKNIQELLHMIHDQTSDIQIAIPDAIPPEVKAGKAGQQQLHEHGLTKEAILGLKRDLDSVASSIAILEKKSNSIVDTMNLIMRSVQDLVGSQSGSKAKLDQLHKVTSMAHDKLSFLEDASKNYQKNTQGFQEMFSNHSTWTSKLLLITVIFQILLICCYILYKRYSRDRSQFAYDRKFI